MMKKLFLIFLVLFAAACTNTENQLKNDKNTVFALDKSNTGRVYSTYPNEKNIKSFGTLVNGKLQGKYLEYYESGSPLFVTNYKDGKLNGTAKKYYSNGKIQVKGYMKDNLAEGKFTFFYKEGGRQSIKNFKHGIYDGYYMEFYPCLLYTSDAADEL